MIPENRKPKLNRVAKGKNTWVGEKKIEIPKAIKTIPNIKGIYQCFNFLETKLSIRNCFD